MKHGNVSLSGKRPELLADILSDSDGLVLLVFWAPWSMRSRSVLEEAEALIVQGEASFRLHAVNVDLQVDVAMKFGLQALPLIVLFRDGRELARSACPFADWSLVSWLKTVSLDGATGQKTARGAFDGDSALKMAVMSALKEKGQAGHIVAGGMPCWQEPRGSISAWLSGNADARRIGRVPGLPYSFLCVLELLGIPWTAEMVTRMFGAIPLGADLSMVAPQFACEMLADSEVVWSRFVTDPSVENFRQRWLSFVRQSLCGIAIEIDQWDGLVIDMALVKSAGRNPDRTVEDTLLDFMSILSPLPEPESDMWASAMCLYGMAINILIFQHMEGWGHKDLTHSDRRASWFIQREQLEPGGSFNDESLRAAHRDWWREHGTEERQYHESLLAIAENLPLRNQKLVVCLLRILQSLA